jgi:hypothetical protein
MPSLPSDPSRKPASPIRGLLPGMLCGALIGFFGFGPASYVYHWEHEGQVIGGKEFFGYHWAAHSPFEHARDHAVGFGFLSSVVGAVWGLVVGERSRRQPIGSRITYLVAIVCLGLGLLHGFTMSRGELGHLVEGPVLSSILAATAGYLGASLFRLWLNRDLTDQDQTDDYN